MLIPPEYEVAAYPNTEENREKIKRIMGERNYKIVDALIGPGLIFSWVNHIINTIPYRVIILMDDREESDEFQELLNSKLCLIKLIDLETLKKNILRLLSSDPDDQKYRETLQLRGRITKPVYNLSSETEKYIDIYNSLV